MTPEERQYWSGQFQSIETRLSLVERETSHANKHLLTEDRAQNIFRTEVVKTNARTRMAVAIIAGVALIGNGTQNVLANHDAMALQLRCEKGASTALEKADKQRDLERHAIADEAARRALQLRDLQIDTLKGKP